MHKMIIESTRVLLIVFFLFTIFSCNKDDDKPVPEPQGYTGTNGIFILNEGNFGAANGSVSFFSPTQDKLYHNLYSEANQTGIGDTPLDMIIFGDTAAISVNISGVVDFVDIKTMESLGFVENIPSPRQLAMYKSSILVSDLSVGVIHILDRKSFQKTGEIQTTKAIEHMIVHGDYLYGACWSNFYVAKPNNTLFKIDLSQNLVIDSLVLAKEPNSMCIDNNKQLWVLCSGGYLNEEAPKLYRIDLQSFSIDFEIEFEQGVDYPSSLNCNGDYLFYLNQGKAWKMNIADNALPTDAFFTAGTSLYNLTAKVGENTVVVTDAKDYQSPGEVYILNISGAIEKSFEAGILPSAACFN